MNTPSTRSLTSLFRNFMLLAVTICCLLSCKPDHDVMKDLFAPVITKLGTTQATAGDPLHIEGRNFGYSASAITVMIDGIPVTVDSLKPGEVSITLSRLLPGNKTVSVKVGGVSSNSKDLTYIAPPGAGNSGYYLNRVNVDLHYRTTTATDVTDYKLFMTGISDSAGGKLYRMRTEMPGVPSADASVFSNRHSTVYTTYRDAAMAAIEDKLAGSPGVVNFQITGLPFHVTMNARPAENDPVNFSNAIRLSYDAITGDILRFFETTKAFSNGEVLGYEDVQTPGGIFTNCLKWSYHTQRVVSDSNISEIHDEHHMLWYAEGVGLVKEVVTGTSGTKTTLLTEIRNR